jgi:hypothetical protein
VLCLRACLRSAVKVAYNWTRWHGIRIKCLVKGAISYFSHPCLQTFKGADKPQRDNAIRPVNSSSKAARTSRPLPLWLFLCLSAAFSWAVWLWPLPVKGTINVVLLGWRFTLPFDIIKLVIGNCLPGVLALVWTASEGRAQMRCLLSSLVGRESLAKW